MDMFQIVFVQKKKKNIIVKKNVNYVEEMYFENININIKLKILMNIIYAKKNMIVKKNVIKMDIVKLTLILNLDK